jgi:hypothetical protein
MGQGSNLWDLRNDGREKRGKNQKSISSVNKNEVEEHRFQFQMNKFKLEKDLSDSRTRKRIQ